MSIIGANATIRGRVDSAFDGGTQPLLFVEPVSIPGGSPDPVELPPESTQDLVTQPVAIAGGWRRVVLVAIAFDPESEYTWASGMSDPDVDAESCGADLRLDGVAPRKDRFDDGLFERALRAEAAAA
jgi:hypothetical protein